MIKDHGPHIKNDEHYKALLDKGIIKEKAAKLNKKELMEALRLY